MAIHLQRPGPTTVRLAGTLRPVRRAPVVPSIAGIAAQGLGTGLVLGVVAAGADPVTPYAAMVGGAGVLIALLGLLVGADL